MISVSRRNATVVAWAQASPDKISARFHNMLMRDDQLALRVRVLGGLFATRPPQGRGPYNHHDGARS